MVRRSRVEQPKSGEQLALPFPFSHGGERKGAGRPKGERVPHAERPYLDGRHPVHVTLRLREGIPSLRKEAWIEGLFGVFEAVKGREEFRVSHFTILTNHIHLIVEACDAECLSRGMQGLTVRLARRINKLAGRKGRVFADRYHAVPLPTPRQTRNALRYVLLNARHHGIYWNGIDPFSTGGFDPRGATLKVLPTEAPVDPPTTWLLSVGWQRAGKFSLESCEQDQEGSPSQDSSECQVEAS